jgi:hypothetical protein
MSPDTNSDLSRRVAELEAEAQHASERYRLYRAKVYGPRLTSFGRLRELERESKLAESRLQRAAAETGARPARSNASARQTPNP